MELFEINSGNQLIMLSKSQTSYGSSSIAVHDDLIRAAAEVSQNSPGQAAAILVDPNQGLDSNDVTPLFADSGANTFLQSDDVLIKLPKPSRLIYIKDTFTLGATVFIPWAVDVHISFAKLSMSKGNATNNLNFQGNEIVFSFRRGTQPSPAGRYVRFSKPVSQFYVNFDNFAVTGRAAFLVGDDICDILGGEVA